MRTFLPFPVICIAFWVSLCRGDPLEADKDKPVATLQIIGLSIDERHTTPSGWSPPSIYLPVTLQITNKSNRDIAISGPDLKSILYECRFYDGQGHAWELKYPAHLIVHEDYLGKRDKHVLKSKETKEVDLKLMVETKLRLINGDLLEPKFRNSVPKDLKFSILTSIPSLTTNLYRFEEILIEGIGITKLITDR